MAKQRGSVRENACEAFIGEGFKTSYRADFDWDFLEPRLNILTNISGLGGVCCYSVDERRQSSGRAAICVCEEGTSLNLKSALSRFLQ